MIRRTLVVLVLLAALTPPAAATPHTYAGSTPTDAPGLSARAMPTQAAPMPAATQTALTRAASIRAASTRADSGDIRQQMSLALTPDHPGEIRVTVTYRLPDNVRSLNATVPKAADVRRLEGFTRADGRTYTWDGVTASPTVVFDFQVNRTYGGARSPPSDGGRSAPDSLDAPPSRSASGTAATAGYSFVDTGPWAIAPVPSLSVVWSYVGTEPVRLDKSLSIDGEGATGGEIAYLGPMSSHTSRANGQRFRLVVPASASLAESPDAVLRALGQASGMLVVGARDEEVFFVAAPTSVDWGPRGLEYGGSDSWVRADAPLSQATNVWFHEYVHTRQAYETTTATKWTTEGVADYYAALLTLRQGRIDFEAFRSHLERGTRAPHADAVLADPSTWERGSNYLKGSLVFGATDRRIRLAGDHSADDVFARMNADADRVTQTEFLAAVEAAGSEQTRQFARKYTETSAVPAVWSRQEHFQAFPVERPISYGFDSATYRVTGPYRNQTVARDVTLVTGETLHVELPVRNDGDEQSTYGVTIRYNGSTVARRTGTLAAGASTTVSLSVPLDSQGTYTVSAGSNAVPFRADPPAPIEIAALSTSPEIPAPGEPVTAQVTVRNPANRPAAGTVVLVVDGAPHGQRQVTLAPGATRTLTYTLSFASSGEHTVGVGNESTTVRVAAKQTPTDRPGTSVPIPLRWSTVIAALALASVLLARE